MFTGFHSDHREQALELIIVESAVSAEKKGDALD